MQFSWVPPHHRLDERTGQKNDIYTTFTHIVDIVADSPMFCQTLNLDETDGGDPTTSTWTEQVQVKRLKVA
jgi:hypothetical protein